MSKSIVILFLILMASHYGNSSIPNIRRTETKDSIILGPKNLINLSYLNNEKKTIFFKWDSSANSGIGVLENSYSFSIKSWYKEEDYGIQATFLKSNDTIDLTENTKNDYLSYINSQIIYLTKTVFKDTLVSQEITKAIRNNKFDFDEKTSDYTIITDGGRYNEVSVSVIHVNYFSNVYIILTKGDNWFAK